MLIRFIAADLPKVRERGDQVCVMWRAISIVVPSSATQPKQQAPGAPLRYDVAWNVFPPEERNPLHWGDDLCTAFATPADPSVGTVLQMNSRLAVSAGKRYNYSSGVFQLDGDGSAGVYALANLSDDQVTLGLAHGLSVNGAHALHPASAVSVGRRQQVLFTPDAQVRVCMVRGPESGSIVSAITSGVTQVAVEKRANTILQYDPQTNTLDEVSS